MDSLLDGAEPSMEEIIAEANTRTLELEKSGIRPGGDKERQEGQVKPVEQRRYPLSGKMYGDPPKSKARFENSPELTGDVDNLPEGTHLIKNWRTGAVVLLQSGYRGENGFRKCLEFHHKDLKFADIQDKNLEGASLNDGDFSNSSLVNTNLKNVKSERTNFDGAELFGVSFDGANLNGSSFRGVNLKNCSMKNCNLKGVNFTGATLPGKIDLEGSDMQGAIMSDGE